MAGEDRDALEARIAALEGDVNRLEDRVAELEKSRDMLTDLWRQMAREGSSAV